jgi:hypothetical protein
VAGIEGTKKDLFLLDMPDMNDRHEVVEASVVTFW